VHTFSLPHTHTSRSSTDGLSSPHLQPLALLLLLLLLLHSVSVVVAAAYGYLDCREISLFTQAETDDRRCLIARRRQDRATLQAVTTMQILKRLFVVQSVLTMAYFLQTIRAWTLNSPPLPLSAQRTHQREHRCSAPFLFEARRPSLLYATVQQQQQQQEQEQEQSAIYTEEDYDDEESTSVVDVSDLTTSEIKSRLLELLRIQSPTTPLTLYEYRAMEDYINALEKDYQPIQTLDFFNLALQGTWQWLFSTHHPLGRTHTVNPDTMCTYNLKSLEQTVDCQQMQGGIAHTVHWELDQNSNGTIDARGTFQVSGNYQITQGSRMAPLVQEETAPVLKLTPGSSLPSNVPALVQWLHRAIPSTLWLWSPLPEVNMSASTAMDVTYMDADLRIVRTTGHARWEGARDIFARVSQIDMAQ
jgi:PAP_fibrillin